MIRSMNGRRGDRMQLMLIDRALGFIQLAEKRDNSFMQIMAAEMNYAFACELALKGLADRDLRGHKLSELFQGLEGDVRDRLCSIYMSLFGIDILQDINVISRYFEDIRYYHEHSGMSGSLGVSRKVGRFLCHYGLQVAKDLRDIKSFSVEFLPSKFQIDE